MKPSMLFYPWKAIRKETIAMVDLFKEEELDYTPFKGAWSIGKTFLHIAESEDWWIHALVRKELPLDLKYELQDYPSNRALKSKLAISHERTIKFLEGIQEADLDWRFKTPEGDSLALYQILWHVLEHEIHHRGELSLILGTLARSGIDV